MYNISVKDAKGTVVIDELDAHIHPEWQLMIKKTLCKMFPKLQFIITTHSPHIISSAEAGEVIIMNKDSRNATLEPSSKSYSGWSTDNILEDIMAVNNLENKKYNLLINRALDSVESKNSTKLLEDIVELKEVSHPNDPIVMSLEIKLAGLKLGDA
ncbi:MAG: AAA family ATPase [Psychrilyobacter sp.]|uniref:AAA family ATPase n=1 Tax=Psychrilyobacter sp. TaxID=2586924 RepID=UPI003C74FF5A